MKRKLLISITLWAILFGAISCEKDKPFVKLPQEFLDYFYFNPGSYWVYKNVDSGDLDTITVESIYIEKIFAKGDDCTFEQAYVTYTDSSLFYNHTAPFTCGETTFIWSSAFEYKRNNQIKYLSSPRIIYPVIKGKSAYIDRKIYVEDVLDSIRIQNNVFFNVGVFAHKLTSDSTLVREFYAKDVGLIRQEFANGAIYELEKFYINR